MGKKTVKIVFLIPFYDKDIEQLKDTIESIKYYSLEDYSIICINDCMKKENINFFEQKLSSEKVVSFMPLYESYWPRNTYGALFCKKYQAMEYAIKHFQFDYLIELDVDALMTGFNLYKHIDKYFKTNDCRIGLIGSYRIRSDGKKRTRWQWALYLLYQVYFRKKISRISLIWSIWFPEARRNGYKLGEHLLGGAFVFSYNCINKIMELYPYKTILENEIFNIEIGDDVLFSMLTFTCGFKIGDFGGPDDPMALALDYIPLAKKEIIRRGKKIIHSVKKGLNGETEEELRAYFKSLRK